MLNSEQVFDLVILFGEGGAVRSRNCFLDRSLMSSKISTKKSYSQTSSDFCLSLH